MKYASIGNWDNYQGKKVRFWVREDFSWKLQRRAKLGYGTESTLDLCNVPGNYRGVPSEGMEQNDMLCLGRREPAGAMAGSGC